MSAFDTQDLIRTAKCGDICSLAQLWDRFGDMMVRQAKRTTRMYAPEIYEDVDGMVYLWFVGIVRDYDPSRMDFAPYCRAKLKQQLFHYIMRRLSVRRREIPLSALHDIESSQSYDELLESALHVDGHEDEAILRAVIGRMHRDMQFLLGLVVAGYTRDECCALMKITKHRYYHLMRAIREVLTAHLTADE